MPNGARNAKNFNKWPELVAMLNAEGHEVIQVAGQNEERVEGVAMFLQGFPLEKLEEVLRDCDTWISVDSWMPHFCATMRLKTGIVIWSQSDPRIWGYKHNINLHKPEFLRQYQYSHWFDVPYNEDAFVEPEVVMDALHGRLALAVTSA
jgi:ADP-heptose:LPS heptosyltransferase